MTLYEVKQHYGRSYRKITQKLMELVDTFDFDIDKQRYLLDVTATDVLADKYIYIRDDDYYKFNVAYRSKKCEFTLCFVFSERSNRFSLRTFSQIVIQLQKEININGSA